MFLGTEYIYDNYCNPDFEMFLNEKYEKSVPTIEKDNAVNSSFLKDIFISFKNIIFCKLNVMPILVTYNLGFNKCMIDRCFKQHFLVLDKIKWCGTMLNVMLILYINV